MSNITQFFGTGALSPEKKKNRRVFHGNNGTTSVTWPVPPDVTEVEVHCWGAGGSGGPPANGAPATYLGRSGGGGGGGYVTHVYPVSSGDLLQITIGASPGGTSSVTIPTQSPTSPISATGGSAGGASIYPAGPAAVGGAGGSGSYTISPGISTSRTFTASGGSGGNGAMPLAPARIASGGAAGSPLGNGGNGANADAFAPPGGQPVAYGGGIGEPGTLTYAGGSIGPGGAGIYGADTTKNIEWFYVDEILGSGGTSSADATAGGGGGGDKAAGILGGAGASYAAPPVGGVAGKAGLAGGGAGASTNGSEGQGGAGLVIIYW